MIRIDKRLEVLQSLVLAVKQVNNNGLNEELDWVEYPNIPYVRELVDKININGSPEIIDFINDINDCGSYTRLFLCFDNQFNFMDSINSLPFKNKKVEDFAKIVKKIYEYENLESVFVKYKDFLDNFELEFNKNNNVNFKNDIANMYGNNNDLNFKSIISLLINGGFGPHQDNNVYYVRGVKNTNFYEYYIVCLFHEFSHFFVNNLVDKYYTDFINVDEIYQESLENGLVNGYKNKKTLLYEYFVRANSLILAEPHISRQEYDENIDWYKEIGFVRIEELIEIIKSGLDKNLQFEEVFKTNCIDYLNNLEFEKSKK